jgi:type II secretory pathway pseudopilin PulG
MIMTIKRAKFATAVTLIEVMVAIIIMSVAVLGASGFRYYAAMDARKADVQVTAARLASLLLSGWKGSGGYSGYSKYDFIGGVDPLDPNGYDSDYDYVGYDPDDYDYDTDDPNSIEFYPGLTVYDDAPGPAVPNGFNALDSGTNPNYRIVVNRVNYYATLSYKDPVGEPRVLNVCVAWINDYQTWTDSKPYQSVRLTTYAND